LLLELLSAFVATPLSILDCLNGQLAGAEIVTSRNAQSRYLYLRPPASLSVDSAKRSVD